MAVCDSRRVYLLMKNTVTRKFAALYLLEQFEIAARKLAPGDLSMQDDLVNHMAVKVLTCPKRRATLGYYAKLGRCRGKDMMRGERVRGRVDLRMEAMRRRERVG